MFKKWISATPGGPGQKIQGGCRVSGKHVYLVRHGESTQNVGVDKELRVPDHAVPLTPRGREQADEAGAFLGRILQGKNPDNIAMWVSPYTRTRETAEIMRRHVCPGTVKEDDMLVELQFGIFDGLSDEEAKATFPMEWARYQSARRFNGKFYARKPEGESPFDCAIRQKLFVDTLYRDFARGGPDTIIIVGHGAALKILRKVIFHYTYEWYEAEPNPANCSIMHLTLDNKARVNLDDGYVYVPAGEPV